MDNLSIRRKIKSIDPDVVICTTIEDVKSCFLLPYIMKNTDFYYYNLEITVFDSWPMKEINYKNILKNQQSYFLLNFILTIYSIAKKLPTSKYEIHPL